MHLMNNYNVSYLLLDAMVHQGLNEQAIVDFNISCIFLPPITVNQLNLTAVKFSLLRVPFRKVF